MKSLRLVSAVAVSAFLFACSNGTGNPGSAEGDVSAVEKSDGAVAQSAKQPAPEAESGSTESEALDEGIAETEIPESSSSEEASSSDTGYSWTEEEISDFLEEFNISPADTARHDPDSVGVWHFYDPRGTHDNPDFAYGEMTDPRDGNVYKTTTIGGQVWMAENLNYFDIEGAASSIKNDWCYWDKPENCESAGRLYTWNVAQRICPEGWRLPTKSDWESLLQEVGADSLNEILWKGSSKLKSKSGWENDGSGTDDFGFTALPAGMKFTTSTQDGFTYHGCSSLMWAATEADGGAADTLAYHMYLDCSNDNAIVNTVKKINGLSVRCVKE